MVLDGPYRFFVGDDEVVGERGAVVFTPRHIPHRFEVASVGSRLLHLFTPGGIDGYFRRNYPAIQSSMSLPPSSGSAFSTDRSAY